MDYEVLYYKVYYRDYYGTHYDVVYTEKEAVSVAHKYILMSYKVRVEKIMAMVNLI